jgi:uncharacterized protein
MTKQFKAWPLYTLLLGFVVPTVAIFGYAYYEGVNAPPPSPAVANEDELTPASTLAEGVFAYFSEEELPREASPDDEPWAVIYPNTVPMKIGTVDVKASVAESWPDRIKGLSDTPYLPKEVVKLFTFDSLAYHGIWMKDMNYAIDIIWVDETNTIVHIVKNATPESYPETFSPTVPALYVIETAAGFVDEHALTTGVSVTLSAL